MAYPDRKSGGIDERLASPGAGNGKVDARSSSSPLTETMIMLREPTLRLLRHTRTHLGEEVDKPGKHTIVVAEPDPKVEPDAIADPDATKKPKKAVMIESFVPRARYSRSVRARQEKRTTSSLIFTTGRIAEGTFRADENGTLRLPTSKPKLVNGKLLQTLDRRKITPERISALATQVGAAQIVK